MAKKIIIAGGGLSGLTCANRLQAKGYKPVLLEAADELGGRIRTDRHKGFLLDRGFQVLLNSYPTPQRLLDFNSLKLGSFEPGALIRMGQRFHQLSDPWRRPGHLFSTAFSRVATFPDKIRMWKLRRETSRLAANSGEWLPEKTTLQYLREFGFSNRLIDRFFRPFFGGVFLEESLATSCRKFTYLFHLFSTGLACLPNQGMQSIIRQLAEPLPHDQIRLGTRIENLSSSHVQLESGEILQADEVVLATDLQAAQQISGSPADGGSHGVGCFYFAADRSPLRGRWLVLNGDEEGPINGLCVPSDASPGYAPVGKSLVSVTVLDTHGDPHAEGLLQQVREQLRGWYGSPVDDWEHLKTYSIPNALPVQEREPTFEAPAGEAGAGQGTPEQKSPVRCGDYLQFASIEGAMSSGTRAAEQVLARLR
ncbi:MAG: NAD(P)/FAD-dependent oxidoreductase [Planctomycetota bacterium]|nr:NAD(P)/FAD-dependent oxidoreductase [Planctomycetota bacterium]